MEGSETGCGRVWTGVRMEDGGERVWTGVDGGEDGRWRERDGVWTGVDGGEDGRWRGAGGGEIFRKIEAEGAADGHDSAGKEVDRGRVRSMFQG